MTELPPDVQHKLYKSEHDVMIAGVLAGLAEYFLVDPTIFRLAYVLLVLVTGVFPGILAYIIAYFIIPDRPRDLGLLKNDPQPVTPPTPATPTTAPEDSTIIPSKDLFRVAHEEMHDRPEKIISTPEDLDIKVDGELKKPQWPTLTDIKNKETDTIPEEIPEPETTSFEDMFDDDSLGLDDLIDE